MNVRSVCLTLVVLALAPAAAAQNKRVLWDTHHGTYGSFYPSGSYATMSSLLTAAGHDIVESAAGVLNHNLSTFDVVVVGVCSASSSAYTAAEALALRAHADAGGGVLMIGDNANVVPQNVVALGQAFDMTLGSVTVTPYDTYVTDLAAGEEMFQGITSVYFRAGGAIGVGPAATAIGKTAAGEPMIARWNQGRVVAVGDLNGFDNGYINNVDNKAWLVKLFEYLGQGCVTSLGPGLAGTGGLVPALSAGSGSCNGALALQLDNAIGGGAALLIVGTGAAQIPASGGTVYVDVFTPPALVLPLPLGGLPGAPGAGFAILGQDVTPYLPLTLVFQFAVFDAGAPFGVALSNGIELTMTP